MPDPATVLDRIVIRAASSPRRILFPDAEGPATVEALKRLAREKIVIPCVPASSATEGLPVGVVSVDADSDPVDGVLTREAPQGHLFHLVELAVPTEAGETVLAFAAAAPQPDPAELAAAARATARQFRLLCEKEPRVALLSFSTHGSARHRRVETVREALDVLRESDPALELGGELQGDAALVAAVAAAKAPGDPVAGRANVLLFPGGDAAEIARALVERLAGARIVGPFQCTPERPVNPVSRGASSDAIVVTAAVTALQAG